MSYGLAAAGLLIAGTANAYDFGNPGEPSASPDNYAGGDYYRFPGIGTSGYLDPGYAFSATEGYGYPGYDVGGYGLRGNGWGGYGYPGYGLSGYGDTGYGYGSVLGARGYYAPPRVRRNPLRRRTGTISGGWKNESGNLKMPTNSRCLPMVCGTVIRRYLPTTADTRVTRRRRRVTSDSLKSRVQVRRAAIIPITRHTSRPTVASPLISSGNE